MYNIYRKDRFTDSHGGGVSQAIKKDITITHHTDLDTKCEIIWTQCQLAGKNSKSILLGSYYRPNSSDMESLDQLDASLLKMNDNINKDNVIIVGDFNAPDIDWQNPNVSSICKQHDLTQFVEEPTRR